MPNDKEYKTKLYDQALVVEQAISPDTNALLLNYTSKYKNYLMEGLTAKREDRFYRFIDLFNPWKRKELSEEMQAAVDECNDVLFSTMRKKLPSFPLIKPEFFGIALNGYGLEYHADAERPFNKGDRDLGWPTQYDDTGFNFPSQPEWQFNHTPKRVYTTLIYLNEDFSGGETTLPIKRLNVKPKKSRLFGFPCTRDYIHGVRPINNGVRIVFTAWYEFNDVPFADGMDSFGEIDHGCPAAASNLPPSKNI